MNDGTIPVAIQDESNRVCEQTAPQFFELAPEVVEVCLRMKSAGGRHELKHRLRPPKLENWIEYERNLKSSVIASEETPEALEFGSAGLEAAVALYDSLFLEASGYCVSGGCEQVACAQIPVHHKEMVIRALGDVGPEPEQEPGEEQENVSLFALDAQHVQVTLLANMQGHRYGGLLHIFTPPTAAHRIAYSRIVSQALYVRGSQSIKTLLPARLGALVKLYDQLISDVSGYALRGKPPADRAAIIKHMDPLHKKAAVQELFER